MASTIVTKNSSTASAVPLTGDLTQGELAVNVTDKRLFTKNSGGTVVELGTNPASLALPNGTANGVAYLNGSKVVTTGSALTFDGTNLGVGLTPSGSFRLEIGGADGTQFAMRSTGTTSARIRGYVNSAESGVIGFLNGGGQYFEVAGSEAMRLTSTGLGIGTSSPGYKLDVNGAFRAYANSAGAYQFAYINNTSATGYARLDLQIGASGANGTATIKYAPGIFMQIGPDTNDTTTPLVFATNNGTERMRLDSSGNLGLGVTPSAWGSSKAIQLGSAASIFAVGSNSYIGANSYYNGTDNKYISNGYATLYSQQSDGAHKFYTAASGTAGGTISFTQAMTLDASGRLAIGTTTAGENLTINSANAANARIGLQYNSSALTYFGSYSGIVGAGNATDTMLAATGVLAFAAGGTTERARIDSSGNLLVKTTTQQFSATCTVLQATASNAVYAAHNSATSGDNNFIWFGTEAGGTTRGTITYNRVAGLVAYNTTSDYRAKTVKGSVQNALEKVVALKPSTGRMNDAEQDIDFFVAHELQEIVPSAVTGEKDAVNEDGTPKYQMVDKSALIPLLTAAIQEQQALIQTLTDRITALEGK